MAAGLGGGCGGVGARARGRRHAPSRARAPRRASRCASSTGASRAELGSAGGPLIVIDNYDSFTYNLVQYFGDEGADVKVVRNDELDCAGVLALRPSGVVISPGPGRPEDSGISLDAVTTLGPVLPLFGVCMGHQCIGQAFGGSVIRAPCGLVHGKSSPVFHREQGVFAGMADPFQAARYHSLVIDKEEDTFPADELEVTAWTEDGTIMGVRHKRYPHIVGVQFHPESVITKDGKRFVTNFLDIIKDFWA